MKSNTKNYLYFTDSFDKFLYKNIDNKIYIFDEIEFNFDIKYTEYNSVSIEYKREVKATNDLEAYYNFIENLYNEHISNLSYVREQLTKLERVERHINLKRYVYEEDRVLLGNFDFISSYNCFGLFVNVLYYKDLLYFHYRLNEENKNKSILSSDKFIEYYKESLKSDMIGKKRAIANNRKNLQVLIKRRNDFKNVYPEIYL